MKMNFKKALFLASVCFATSGSRAEATQSMAEATRSNFAAGVTFGTLGFGIRGEYKINDYLVGRIGGDYLPTVDLASLVKEASKELGDFKKNGDIEGEVLFKRASIGGGLSIHPFQNGFFIFGGFIYNVCNFTWKALRLKDNITHKGQLLTRGGLGDVDLRSGVKKVSPCMSIGYSGTFTQDRSWCFLTEVGFIYQQVKKVELELTSNTTPGVTSNKEALEKWANCCDDEMKDHLKGALRIYPCLSLGLSYRF